MTLNRRQFFVQLGKAAAVVATISLFPFRLLRGPRTLFVGRGHKTEYDYLSLAAAIRASESGDDIVLMSPYFTDRSGFITLSTDSAKKGR
jgi:hypothetical protein